MVVVGTQVVDTGVAAAYPWASSVVAVAVDTSWVAAFPWASSAAGVGTWVACTVVACP